MKRFLISIIIILFLTSSHRQSGQTSWIRINLLGYTPKGMKVAVWCSKSRLAIDFWQLVDAGSNKTVYSGRLEKAFGAYGPFIQTFRLNFSSFTKPGKYYLQAGSARSAEFRIADDVYSGAADYCLRYMRQQRCGFNPFLKDSCHTHDGYVVYGEKAGIKDSTHVDAVGGWHDASDYLKYSATSANATYHLLMAYRDFKNVFPDEKLANGLNGKNGLSDVLDEAKWGLDWLLKMYPRDDWMFNQVADDRDHMGMRIPKEDSFYGRDHERPVYFITGEPQQRGKFMNNTSGTSSTAGKFASAFALGAEVFERISADYSYQLYQKSFSAITVGLKKQGFTQTVSVRSPYIYAEDNWADDMELASAAIGNAYKLNKYVLGDLYSEKRNSKSRGLQLAYLMAKKEPTTPWLGADTANHYQWYPFVNIGHYELAKQLKGKQKNTIIGYYKRGIQKVWDKAQQNAFYRGVPFIWCSNNLTTSFAIQCYWYRQLTNDKQFQELEQANFDWLFGCNPWGTSFVYGLPGNEDNPTDPHSAFTHLKNYPIDGGLVDGPVYGSIYKNLIGITLYQPDEFADFQSDLAVYHDDYGDYSTNEPTMDGTASLIYLLAAKESEAGKQNKFTYSHGGIIRGDSTKKQIALVFTGDEFADGGDLIANTLSQQKINASFFLTGSFYNNYPNEKIIDKLLRNGNFLGNHSDKHLLYCDWNNRDSLLVDKLEFLGDLFGPMERIGHLAEKAEKFGNSHLPMGYFLPPYEWYNDSVAAWCKESGIQLINYTPGTLSAADYKTPSDRNYRNSESIYNSIIGYEQTHTSGLNGFILLMHIGTDPKRTDKFYYKLPKLINYFKSKGYRFKTIDQLILR
jgi:peptidoglycan/xylan/chitin deacetylase (PgdA/CDA1 family)